MPPEKGPLTRKALYLPGEMRRSLPSPPKMEESGVSHVADASITMRKGKRSTASVGRGTIPSRSSWNAARAVWKMVAKRRRERITAARVFTTAGLDFGKELPDGSRRGERQVSGRCCEAQGLGVR